VNSREVSAGLRYKKPPLSCILADDFSISFHYITLFCSNLLIINISRYPRFIAMKVSLVALAFTLAHAAPAAHQAAPRAPEPSGSPFTSICSSDTLYFDCDVVNIAGVAYGRGTCQEVIVSEGFLQGKDRFS
jgi:hypothetical protein